MSAVASAPIRRSFNRGLAAIAFAGVLLVVVLAGLLPLSGPYGWVLVLFPINALVYLGAGLLAWYHRPSNRMGALILLTGAFVFLGGAGNTSAPALIVLGAVGASLPLAGFVHMLLAFPLGKLPDRLARVTVAAAYANSLILQIPSYLFTPDPALPGLALADAPALVQASRAGQELVGLIVLLLTLVQLARRLRRASAAEKRVLVPLYGYGIVAVAVMLGAARVLAPYLHWPGPHVAALQLYVFIGVPIAVALGALRGGVARTGELEELGVWLGDAGDAKPAIGEALARTLGDPTLEVWFWVRRTESYVDVNGRAVSAERQAAPRGLVPVELDGRRIGAISCDIALMSTPDLVQTAGRVVAISLDRERLIAELLASRRALQISRERLVEVADLERRRIAQDLHDGLQVQLVLLALEAQQLANASGGGDVVSGRATDLRKGIDEAAAGLREVVHSVMPAALTQRGLSAAAEDLVDRMPVPTSLALGVVDGDCPPVVESTAYFVVAEALANAVKHSRAGAISVALNRRDETLHVEIADNGDGGASPGTGAGLYSMAERIDALGGQLLIVSEPGAGTTIRAEIPCGLS